MDEIAMDVDLKTTFINHLQSEAEQLRKWAWEARQGGWSTQQVDPMRKRADELDQLRFVVEKMK